MDEKFIIEPIAHIKTDFPEKFGVPRQSGLVNELVSKIVFEPGFRDPNALRGLEQYSHIWLIWQFSKTENNNWSATIRPPKLGGNKRVGVFASRSPFRPNRLGLSCVELDRIEQEKGFGSVIYVRGADLVDGTPIYDIKPYLPYTDCREDALTGYSFDGEKAYINVEFEDKLVSRFPDTLLSKIKAVLSQDPHPSYKTDEERIYKMNFAGYLISFKVGENVINVIDIRPDNIAKNS